MKNKPIVTTSKPVRVLSLGAGVQSSTVFLMSCLGELPKLDFAVFADTQWEPAAVYRHLAFLEQAARKYGIPIYCVTAGNIREDLLQNFMQDSNHWASMPFFTLIDGKRGILQRQCTREYKIDPVRLKIKEVLGLLPRARIQPEAVELWFGISTDEARRVRISRVAWIKHVYPLIFTKPMNRNACLTWMLSKEYPRPARSACIGCPYHTDAEWRTIARSAKEWVEAVKMDQAIRMRGGKRMSLYLHKSCRPLAEIDFRSA